jgi:hypothetical protein
MSFDQALAIVSESSIVRLATPNWMYMLPIKGRVQVELSAYYTSDHIAYLQFAGR